MTESNTILNMHDPADNMPICNSQSASGTAFVNLADNEEGENSDIITFLNSSTPELSLDSDSNDVSVQNIFTHYHTDDELNSLTHAHENQLLITHFNIRSLNKNFDQFLSFVSNLSTKHNIIGLSETWLKDTSPSSLFAIDGYRLLTNNRKCKKGGGVGFYVSQNLDCSVLEEYTIMSETFESLFIEIKTSNNGTIIIGEIYRPPHSNPTEFVEHFDGILSNKYLDNKTCFILGDFNHNLLNSNNNPTCAEFLNLMLSKSFIPLTRKPTRITDVASTLIDNIFVNNLFLVLTSGIVVSDVTDHFPIYVLVSNFLNVKSHQTYKPGIRVMSDSNLSNLRDRLRSADWSAVYNHRNLNASFESFLTTLITHYNSCAPLHKSN